VQRQGLDLPLAAIALFKQACTLGLCTRPCLFVLPEPFTHTLAYRPTLHTHHSLCTMRRAVLAGPQLRPPQQRDGNTADGFSCFLTHRRRSRAHGSKLMPANDSRFATQIALEYEFASAELWVRFAAGAQILLHFSFLQELCPVGLFSVCASHSARHNKFHNDGADFCFFARRCLPLLCAGSALCIREMCMASL
jgi:hypothetical protein